LLYKAHIAKLQLALFTRFLTDCDLAIYIQPMVEAGVFCIDQVSEIDESALAERYRFKKVGQIVSSRLLMLD
jgi:hypothetical protein